MADDPTYRWNWKPMTQGDTRPATNFTETLSTSALTAVKIRLKLPDATAASITLSNGSGMTIVTATAGAWNFNIDRMTAATTDAYTAGIYTYEMSTTDAAGVVTTVLKGAWELIARIPTA